MKYRRLVNLLTVLSFLPFAAAVGLWVRSYAVYADCLYRHGPVHAVSVVSRGGIVEVRHHAYDPPRVRTADEARWRFVANGLRVMLSAGEAVKYNAIGFGRFHATYPLAGSTFDIYVIPWWHVVLLTALFPALMIRGGVRRRRKERRASLGLCFACGYDLRATPGRCPECGAGLATTSAAAN